MINQGRRSPPFGYEELVAHLELIRTYLRRKELAKSDAIIWPIFLCHVSQPATVPIYDVNVWRAWGYLVGGTARRVPRSRPRTLKHYLEYRVWFNQLVADHDLDRRRLDRALMALGQSLARPQVSLLA